MTSENDGKRPTDWDDYRSRMDRVVTRDGLQRGLAFRPGPTDVLISPYAKSGTTWLQQIVHGLRTNGDMDFDDISRVVPWIETSPDLGLDLDAEQGARPRAYKSHLAADAIPAGGRYLVSLRDPKDALVSLYRFMEGWFFEPGAFSIGDFARRQYFQRGERRDYWHHLRSWWKRRDEESVLLLTFEDMKADLPPVVRRIAEFIGVSFDPNLLDLVVKQASLEFMLAHKDRFDDLLMRERAEAAAGLARGGDSSKVRTGEVGSHRYELPEDVSSQMDEIWKEEIGGVLGFATYDDLRTALGC